MSTGVRFDFTLLWFSLNTIFLVDLCYNFEISHIVFAGLAITSAGAAEAAVAFAFAFTA